MIYTYYLTRSFSKRVNLCINNELLQMFEDTTTEQRLLRIVGIGCTSSNEKEYATITIFT